MDRPKVGPSGVPNTKYKIPVLYLLLGFSIVVEYKKQKTKKKVNFLFCQGTKQAPCDKILEFFCTSIVQVHN